MRNTSNCTVHNTSCIVTMIMVDNLDVMSNNSVLTRDSGFEFSVD